MNWPFMARVYAALTLAFVAAPVQAEISTRAALAAIQPVQSCDGLAAAPLADALGATVTVQAKTIETPKGRFCQVTGNIAPTIGFEVDLPSEKWTQRFLQAGCGGLCGMVNASIGNAQSCLPALNGEFVVAATDLGHKGQMGSPTEGDFAEDSQKRIDFAYRANHLTALAAKALIRAYYGQAPRYSYFSGCSDGGREALMEAQRFPDDFDGISAGAPAMLFQIQNSFFHAWTVAANTRADGSHILLAGKLPILHDAVIAHCDRLDGDADGLLSDPRACKVDPAWVKCGAGSAESGKCLSDEEWSVAEKLYDGPVDGPVDGAGGHFLPGGLQPGSEMQWGAFVPREARDKQVSARMAASMAKVVLADAGASDSDAAHYSFSLAQLARLQKLHALNDATNTDLAPFAARGGKLIQWHGWSDGSIAPMISIAYFEAVQQQLGAASVEKFMRLYMLPGVGHCGGGDGFSQFDTLTPLLAWVETGAAPGALKADKIAAHEMGPPGPPAGAPNAMPAGPDGRGGGPGFSRPPAPFAIAAQPALASRMIEPFSGVGAQGRAAVHDWLGAGWLGPDFQRTYIVKAGSAQPALR